MVDGRQQALDGVRLHARPGQTYAEHRWIAHRLARREVFAEALDQHGVTAPPLLGDGRRIAHGRARVERLEVPHHIVQRAGRIAAQLGDDRVEQALTVRALAQRLEGGAAQAPDAPEGVLAHGGKLDLRRGQQRHRLLELGKAEQVARMRGVFRPALQRPGQRLQPLGRGLGRQDLALGGRARRLGRGGLADLGPPSPEREDGGAQQNEGRQGEGDVAQAIAPPGAELSPRAARISRRRELRWRRDD